MYGFQALWSDKDNKYSYIFAFLPFTDGGDLEDYGDSAHLNVNFHNTRVLVGDEGRFWDLSTWCSFTLERFSSLPPYSRLVCLS